MEAVSAAELAEAAARLELQLAAAEGRLEVAPPGWVQLAMEEKVKEELVGVVLVEVEMAAVGMGAVVVEEQPVAVAGPEARHWVSSAAWMALGCMAQVEMEAADKWWETQEGGAMVAVAKVVAVTVEGVREVAEVGLVVLAAQSVAVVMAVVVMAVVVRAVVAMEGEEVVAI